MRGKTYTNNSALSNAREYICIETLETVVALMDTANQYVLWVTKTVLANNYTEKEDDLLA